tara:strand:+ start:1278 stop:3650 length:2373 start_codon:yes stop_codon:yes gene_type:complete
MEETGPNFDGSEKGARNLKEELSEILFSSRDIAQEARDIAAGLGMSTLEAREFRKAFKETADIAKDLESGFDKILEGTRKEKDVQKDIEKNLNSRRSIEREISQVLMKENLFSQNEITEAMGNQNGLLHLSADTQKDISNEILEAVDLADEQIANNTRNNKILEEQFRLLETGNTELVGALSSTSDLFKKIGLTKISKPLEAAGEAARTAALNGKDFKGQLEAATLQAKKLIAEMVLLAIVTAGLKFDEQVANFSRDMGVTRSEASKLRREMTEIANDSGTFSINSADTLKAITNLQNQFGTVGNVLRKDIVGEMAKLGKLTNMSAESQGNFARFANISGKNAAVITKETRRAVVNAEQEKGLRVDINKTLDEAGKINGQIAAQLDGNVTKIASAVAVAKQFGMTLEGVAAAGAQLLDFESSISNELEAELLIGKEINLEKARLAALTGDYETLTREINKNIGDFGDFTKMNVLQQNALAKSVGMTADGLSDVLLKNENIEQLAAEARAMGDEDLAKQLERRSAQEKFTDALDKMKQIFVDIVGGPVGTLLSAIGSIFGFISKIGSALGGGENSLMNWAITAGLLLKTFSILRGVMRSNYALLLKSRHTQLGKYILGKKQLLTEGLMNMRKKMGLGLDMRGLVLGTIRLARTIATAVAEASVLAFKTAGIGLLLAIPAALAAGALIKSMAKAEHGADFTTNGPMPLMVGDNIGGKERVSVTPIGSENKNGPNNQTTDMSETNGKLETIATGIAALVSQPKFQSIYQTRGQNNGTIAQGTLTHGSVGDSYS